VKKKDNCEEVIYVEQMPEKRNRKKTYEGLLAHEVEEQMKEINKKSDSGKKDPNEE